MVKAVTPIPFVKARFFDRCGKPLSGGKVYTYDANTTTDKATYKDPYGLTPNTNPVILDAAGEADIYLEGTYRIRITDRQDVLVNDVAKIGSWFSDNLQDTLNDISGAMSATMQPIINALTSLEAGKNGWTDLLVQTQNGRTQAAKNAETMSVKDFGAKGDKTTDDTDAIERAITAAEQTGKKLYFPAGIYRLTRTITRRAGSTWQGESCREKGVGGGEKMDGTWLYFDHLDKGIHFSGSAGYFVGVDINGFGIRRNQVGVDGSTTNWQPQDADYDFYTEGMASITISDMLFLCSTRGIYAGGTSESFGAGRVNIYRINGQFFKNAIKIDYCYDVVRIDQLHVWPFWIAHDLLHNYMMQNLDVIHLVRCDNPMISNIFSIFARSGLRVSAGSGGGASKIHLVNADFDRGNMGIWLDSTCNTVTGHIDNYTSQSETGGSKSIFIEGSNNHLQFGNVYVANLDTNAVRVEGSNNKLEFGSLKIVDYDLANQGVPAIEAGTGNTISISSLPSITSKTGKTNKYGTTGNILVDDWRDFTPIVSSAVGTLGTLSTTGDYKITGSTATVRFDIKIVSNGTASGDVRFNIPFGSIANNSTSGGREIDIEGCALSCTAQFGNNFIVINKFDNTYAGKDGARLVGEIKYRINI